VTRVFLTIILPLVLPTALYDVWMATVGRADGGASASAWRDPPWVWLAGAGIVLAAAVVVAIVQFGSNGEGTYVPPHVENGVIVPGHVVPAPTQH